MIKLFFKLFSHIDLTCRISQVVFNGELEVMDKSKKMEPLDKRRVSQKSEKTAAGGSRPVFDKNGHLINYGGGASSSSRVQPTPDLLHEE
jgi:hypothetical protein